jgi:rhodanese-related sulfurtransferase
MATNKFLLVAGLSIFLVVFLGCDKATEPEDVDEFALLEEAGSAYFASYTSVSGKAINIDIADVFSTGLSSWTIVDYRSAADFASGHLTGAVNVNKDSLFVRIDDGAVSTSKTILNVCYTGQTASRATCALNLAGIDAQNLKFGMCAVVPGADTGYVGGGGKWAAQVAADEGFTLETTSNDVTTQPANTFPTLNTGESAVADIVRARFAGTWKAKKAADVFAAPGNFFIINYWPKSEYDQGHITGAFQFTPKSSLGKDQLLKYLPTNKPIVVYCYSGQTSAQIITYLNMLGYDAYTLTFGVNGFDYALLATIGKGQFKAQTNDYSSIIAK